MLTNIELKRRYLKMLKLSAQWHREHPEYRREYWKANKVELSEKHKRYVKKNWKKIQAYQKKYRETHRKVE